jgi:uncharacterized protein YqgC (DUF456 family)
MWWYYFWATALLIANGLAWCGNLFALPGNWVVVALTALFVWLVPTRNSQSPAMSWTVVIVIIVLAVVGEMLEFLAGAAGAAKHGASRRSVILSVLGAIVGSCSGVTVGLPLPLVGSVIGAVIGGAIGAFAGAYLGETWKGRDADVSVRVAQGAFAGRLWGTAAKLAVGAVIVVIVTFSSFF